MLIEFNVENFRSIKEEVTLSMISTKDSSFENHLIHSELLKDEALLKSAVLYGPNASGKTNVLLAINLLKSLVVTSHERQKGDKLPFTPFKLEKIYLLKPTRFKVIFMKSGVKYLYEIAFNSEKILKESLYNFPKNYKKIIFERNETINFKFTVDEKKQKIISERTLPNVLYLSKATQDNYEPISKVYDWFKDDLQIIGPTDYPALSEFTAKMLNDESMKKFVMKALLEADVGIDDILVRKQKLKNEDLPKDMPEEIKKLIIKQEQTKINTIHKGITFDFDKEESEGTQRIFSIIGPWIDALKTGKILVVDELDTKLHHLLNVFLISLFHNPTQNKKNAQLIFTTHNTNLLDIQDIFRRDQIWFTEKNISTGATDLYSLIEYSPRKDKNIERGYLAGKYGALPFIKEIKIF